MISPCIMWRELVGSPVPGEVDLSFCLIVCLK